MSETVQVGCYVRVSTTDQNLDRQLSSTTEYAQDELEEDLRDVHTYRDTSTGMNTKRATEQFRMTLL